ncbi:MAG: hypothetical protein AAFR91_02705 [Pseudomonadota bacterium]
MGAENESTHAFDSRKLRHVDLSGHRDGVAFRRANTCEFDCSAHGRRHHPAHRAIDKAGLRSFAEQGNSAAMVLYGMYNSAEAKGEDPGRLVSMVTQFSITPSNLGFIAVGGADPGVAGTPRAQ